MTNLANVAAEAGASLDQAVRIGMYLSNLKHFHEMDLAYREFMPELPPVRTTIQSALIGFDVEADNPDVIEASPVEHPNLVERPAQIDRSIDGWQRKQNARNLPVRRRPTGRSNEIGAVEIGGHGENSKSFGRDRTCGADLYGCNPQRSSSGDRAGINLHDEIQIFISSAAQRDGLIDDEGIGWIAQIDRLQQWRFNCRLRDRLMWTTCQCQTKTAENENRGNSGHGKSMHTI